MPRSGPQASVSQMSAPGERGRHDRGGEQGDVDPMAAQFSLARFGDDLSRKSSPCWRRRTPDVPGSTKGRAGADQGSSRRVGSAWMARTRTAVQSRVS